MGLHWVHLHPQDGEKIRHNLQRKFVSVSPAHQVHSQAEQSFFMQGGVDL